MARQRHSLRSFFTKKRLGVSLFVALLLAVAAWWGSGVWQERKGGVPSAVSAPVGSVVPLEATSSETAAVLRDMAREASAVAPSAAGSASAAGEQAVSASAFPVPRRAVPVKGKIALIIDDMGVEEDLSARMLEDLPVEVTPAFLPQGFYSVADAKKAKAQGRVVMLHLPTEPQPRPNEPGLDAGPDALLASDDTDAVRRKTEAHIQALLPYISGVNNHMGSLFTEQAEGMVAALEVIHSHGLFFVDSMTTPRSVGLKTARRLGMPSVGRDVFLDHVIDTAHVEGELKKLERLALKRGVAVAIGHPHAVTLDALQAWVPTLADKGLALVRVTDVLK